MSYRETVNAFVRAESTNRYRSADALPMSEWAEERRETMTPGTVAWNHVVHVTDVAADVREVLQDPDASVAQVAAAARRLLAAIGEHGGGPRFVKDADGDTWQVCVDGKYRLEGHPGSIALDYERLGKAFGPLTPTKTTKGQK